MPSGLRRRMLRGRTSRAWLVLAVLGTAGAAHADTAAVNSRVQAARARLAGLIADAGVDGRFVERIRGTYAFAPLAADLPLAPVANPDAITPLAAGPVVRVSGRMDGQGGLTVASFEIPTPSFVATASEAVGGAAREIFRILNRVVKQTPPAVAARARALPPSLPDYKAVNDQIDTIVRSYGAAVAKGGQDDATRKIAADWASVRAVVGDTFPDSKQYKAIYGSLDNYPPWSYDRIFRQSAAAVAIAEPGSTTSLCSGVLIAPDLVLTAGHCFSGPPVRPPDTLEVWFGYADPPGGGPRNVARRAIKEIVAPGPQRVAELLAGRYGASLYDYAVVRIESSAANAASPKPDASTVAQAQCLRPQPLHKGDPIYVLGYPRGDPATVHDSARVYLPYRVQDGDEFLRLRLDIEADLLGRANVAEAMKEFDDSYDRVTDKSIDWRVLRSVRDGGQPRMGIVADTFNGDSGAPVYDRERQQCVVGILLQGSPDTGVRRRPNWKEHERVLPTTAVLDDLAADAKTDGLLKQLIIK